MNCLMTNDEFENSLNISFIRFSYEKKKRLRKSWASAQNDVFYDLVWYLWYLNVRWVKATGYGVKEISIRRDDELRTRSKQVLTRRSLEWAVWERRHNICFVTLRRVRTHIMDERPVVDLEMILWLMLNFWNSSSNLAMKWDFPPAFPKHRLGASYPRPRFLPQRNPLSCLRQERTLDHNRCRCGIYSDFFWRW